MTESQYSSVGTPECPAMPHQPVPPEHARFARALSAAVARWMKLRGYTCVNQLRTVIPDAYRVSAQTLYSTLYHASRPSVYVMRAIAAALGLTLEALIAEADDLLKRGVKLKTVADEFRGKTKQGRPRSRRGHKWNALRKKQKKADAQRSK